MFRILSRWKAKRTAKKEALTAWYNEFREVLNSPTDAMDSMIERAFKSIPKKILKTPKGRQLEGHFYGRVVPTILHEARLSAIKAATKETHKKVAKAIAQRSESEGPTNFDGYADLHIKK